MQAIPNPPPQAQNLSKGGLMLVKSNADLQREVRREAEERQHEAPITGLAAHIRKAWEDAKRAKLDIDDDLLRDLRQRNGEYSDSKLAEIRKAGASEIFIKLTLNKCLSAQSWLYDIYMQPGEKPFDITPTPIPEIPPPLDQQVAADVAREFAMETMQTGLMPSAGDYEDRLQKARDEILEETRELAEERAKAMKTLISDQLAEGGFFNVFGEFLADLTTFKSAFIKGPITRRKPSLVWVSEQEGFMQEEALIVEFERVSPFDIFPSSSSTGIGDGFLIHRLRLNPGELRQYIDVPGYDTEAIRAVIDEYGKGGLKEWTSADSERDDLEQRDFEGSLGAKIECLEYWGEVLGRHLRDWGMSEEEVPDNTKTYQVSAMLIGRWVIRAVINSDPLGKIPFHRTSWVNVPGSFWGLSLPEVIEDSQSMVNAAARSLANNQAISSGPQAVVDVDALPMGANISNMHPWKIWQVSSKGLAGTNGRLEPIRFFQPNANTRELLEVYTHYARQADEISGIPAYMTGAGKTDGAGSTASGYAMMMENAARGLKRVVANIDEDIFKPLLENLYRYNMQYSDDDKVKGDLVVVARGSSSLIQKQNQAVRRNELLQVVLNSPPIQEIIGVKGLASLLRETIKSMDIKLDDIVPSEEEIDAMIQQQQMQAMAMQQQAAAPETLSMAGNPVADYQG